MVGWDNLILLTISDALRHLCTLRSARIFWRCESPAALRNLRTIFDVQHVFIFIDIYMLSEE